MIRYSFTIRLFASFAPSLRPSRLKVEAAMHRLEAPASGILTILLLLLATIPSFSQADPQTYLGETKTELTKKWPENRTINLVFHGHSVPTGYFSTPEVRTLEAYPHLLLKALKAVYPNAAINVITTSIGGENSEQGEKRFKKEVLPHRPDVLFIDYALNDRSIGAERSGEAMEKMIKKALKKKIKVILLTPSPDLRADLKDPHNELAPFAGLLVALAQKYNIGLADSYEAFKQKAEKGEDLRPYMAQSNHPNKEGHELIVSELMKYFK